jgi:hypothetical protein
MSKQITTVAEYNVREEVEKVLQRQESSWDARLSNIQICTNSSLRIHSPHFYSLLNCRQMSLCLHNQDFLLNWRLIYMITNFI